MPDIQDLGCITNAEVIQKFISLDGKRVVDVGCGAMDFSRQLVDAGANVLAIDPDPVQAKLNRACEPVSGLEFAEASAEHIPVDDNSIDGVFYSYSLHHVPASIYAQAFQETIRVLKPDGFLYVIEPIGCPLNEVMKLFHDEEFVRAAAQTALEELAIPAFQSVDVVTYHSIRKFASYEDFAQTFASRTFNPGYSEADVRSPEVEEAFEKHGRPDYCFEAPKQVTFLRGLKV